MKEQEKELPDRRYERSMNHNYLVLSTYQFFVDVQEESYIERMLLENQIPGLLPVISRHKEGEKQYCYEINSLQSLDRLYEKQEMSYEALQKLLTGCIRCFERLEEYLLDGSQVLLLPEYIYVHMDTKEPYFVCYPNYCITNKRFLQQKRPVRKVKILLRGSRGGPGPGPGCPPEGRSN